MILTRLKGNHLVRLKTSPQCLETIVLSIKKRVLQFDTFHLLYLLLPLNACVLNTLKWVLLNILPFNCKIMSRMPHTISAHILIDFHMYAIWMFQHTRIQDKEFKTVWLAIRWVHFSMFIWLLFIQNVVSHGMICSFMHIAYIIRSFDPL